MENKKPVASCMLTYNHVLKFYDVEYGIDDYAIIGMNNDNPRKYKLYNTEKGSYINYNGHRYYMSEFIRV